ncbi:MAG: hypothetical protein ACYC5X_04830 [Syntrophales bacterium]
MGAFRIATYNVNSIRSRLHIIIPWLTDHRPDCLCMQARSLNCDIDMNPRLADKPSDHTILVADFATG